MQIVKGIKPPSPGEVRFKTSFAFLPTLAGGALIWFERFEKMEAWVLTQYVVNINEKQVPIFHGEWKLVSTRLITKKR